VYGTNQGLVTIAAIPVMVKDYALITKKAYFLTRLNLDHPKDKQIDEKSIFSMSIT
jgi:hypothetical protein